MIAQRAPKQTKADERRAYDIATRRDAGKCQRCGLYGDVQRDHRQNRQRGNTVPSNLVCLCLPCHRFKTEHPERAIADGWAVPRWADPRIWPARRWVHDELLWVTYDDDGHWKPISDEDAMRRMGRGEIGIPVMGSGRRRSGLES